MKNKIISNIVFVLILAGVYILFDYHHILFFRPQSVHNWRQSDCASIALNYSEEGMHFFQPSLHNLTSDGGTSGKASTSEAPVLYYLVALFYRIFGHHEFLFRLTNLLLFSAGLFCVFSMLGRRWDQHPASMLIPLILLSSPVLAYYANNFLSDMAALSLALMAWCVLFKYFEQYKPSQLFLAIFLLTISALLKITAILSFLVVLFLFASEWAGIISYRKEKKLFPRPWQFLASAFAGFMLIAGWTLYAIWYNDKHSSTYFSTTTFPLWSLDAEGIKGVLFNIRKIWFYEYFNGITWVFLAGCVALLLVYFRKSVRLTVSIALVLAAGAGSFIVLQFWTLKNHDYYTINLFILPLFAMVAALDLLHRNHSILFRSVWISGILSILTIFSVLQTSSKLKSRYNGWMNEEAELYRDFYNITPVLRKAGISRTDTVIAIPGGSHLALYLSDQKGWTEHRDMRLGREEPVAYNRDSAGIALSVSRGARYMMVSGEDQLEEKPYLLSFARHLVLKHGKVLLFDLHNPVKNYTGIVRELREKLYCDLEMISGDGLYFLTENPHFTPGNAESVDTGFGRSGKNSIALNEQNPFGLTIRLENISAGERIVVSAWRLGRNKPGSIVIAGEPVDLLYYDASTVAELDSNGWERITASLTIPEKLDGKTIKIYLYQPDKELVHFDDFSLEWFKGNSTNQ